MKTPVGVSPIIAFIRESMIGVTDHVSIRTAFDNYVQGSNTECLQKTRQSCFDLIQILEGELLARLGNR